MKKYGLYALALLALVACGQEETATNTTATTSQAVKTETQNLAVREVSVSSLMGSPLSVEVAGVDHAVNGKLVFIQHGLASNREHPAVQETKKAFLNDGYVVISFDSRYSTGKSGREVEKARLSTFQADLNTVINWARQQYFYAEPFALAGHSLGGASVLSYAIDHPHMVNRIVGIAPVVSGQRWENSCRSFTPQFCRKWRADGVYSYKNGDEEISLPYQIIEDAKSYDAVARAQDIEANVLLVSPKLDTVISPKHIRQLYNNLYHPKHLAEIKNSDHNFSKPQNRQDLYNAISTFLQK